jgi:hypothetical protein
VCEFCPFFVKKIMRFLTVATLLAVACLALISPAKGDDGALRGDLPRTIESVLGQMIVNYTREVDAISAAYCDLTTSGRRYWNVATGAIDMVAISNAISDYSAVVTRYSCANILHYRRNGTLSSIVEQEEISQSLPLITAVGAGTGVGTLAYDNVIQGMALPRLCLQKQQVGHPMISQPNGDGTDQFVATVDMSAKFRVVNPLVVTPCTPPSILSGGVCFPTSANYQLASTYIWASGSGARTFYFQRIFVGRDVRFCLQEIHDGDRFVLRSISPSPSVVGGPLFT